MSHQPQIRSNSLREDEQGLENDHNQYSEFQDGKGFIVPFNATAAARERLSSPPFIGESSVIQELFSVIDRVSALNSSVFITGATGTGKELIARAIHARSPRASEPFIDINCSAIPETLFEAEVFGHQRGTFTGAHETRRGLFEEASGGTLFLDEVHALSLSSQAKLLRVLQEHQVRRVGGRENIPINVRIIAATNSDLRATLAEGTFRADLYFRLAVVPLHLPDLRERGNDIELLIAHFLHRHSDRNGDARKRRFSAEAMKVLLAYHWPGNVRELENAVEYTLAISDRELLRPEDLPRSILLESASRTSIGEQCLRDNASLADLERAYVMAMYERHNHHQIRTAAALGIDRRTLYRKLKDFGAFQEADKGLSSRARRAHSAKR